MHSLDDINFVSMMAVCNNMMYKYLSREDLMVIHYVYASLHLQLILLALFKAEVKN